MVIAMTLALIVGTLSFFWVYLHIAFESGGSSLERFANAGYVRLQNWMLNPSEFDHTGAGAIGVWLYVCPLLHYDAKVIFMVSISPGGICYFK